MNISILGGGSWGTALAVHLAGNNHRVRIWEFLKKQASQMQGDRICPLLPGAKLTKNIFVSSKMEEVLPGSELVLVVVPSDKVEATMEKAKGLIKKQPLIIASKGFTDNLKLLSEVVGEKAKGEIYCLYGPTHAEEVCKGMFSSVVLAGGKGKERLKKELESDALKIDLSEDIIGVQVASALKNIIAIMLGIIDGAGLGDNAKAYVFTKAIEEIKEVGVKWGGKEETFYGLAGVGDIFVTGTSTHSRNFTLGREIGKGRKLEEVLTGMKMVVEGVTAVKQIPLLKEKFGLKLPLMTRVYEILFEKGKAKEVLSRICI